MYMLTLFILMMHVHVDIVYTDDACTCYTDDACTF